LREANSDSDEVQALGRRLPRLHRDRRPRTEPFEYLNPGGRRLIGAALDVDVTSTRIVDYATDEGLADSNSESCPRFLAQRPLGGRVDAARSSRRAPDPGRDLDLPREGRREPRAHSPPTSGQRDITDLPGCGDGAAQSWQSSVSTATQIRLRRPGGRTHTRIAADVHDDQVQVCAAVDLRSDSFGARSGSGRRSSWAGPDVLQATVSGATGATPRTPLRPGATGPGAGTSPRSALPPADEIFEGTEIPLGRPRRPGTGVSPTATRTIATGSPRRHDFTRAQACRGRTLPSPSPGRAGFSRSASPTTASVWLRTRRPSPGHRGLVGMQDRAPGRRREVHGQPPVRPADRS